jgi:hypothetical protein
VRTFVRRCHVLFESIRLDGVAGEGDDGGGEGDDGGGEGDTGTRAARLAQLMGRLDEASTVEARRAELQRDVAAAAAELDDAFGAGDDGERLRSELAEGSLLKWAAEREELQPSIEDLQRREEAAVRHHQSIAEAMSQIAGSARIADRRAGQDAAQVPRARNCSVPPAADSRSARARAAAGSHCQSG